MTVVLNRLPHICNYTTILVPYFQATALEKEAEDLLESEGPDCPFLEPLVTRAEWGAFRKRV